ncbi:hypothetical protein [Bradyrhizobium sp. CER78]|uniref:hypothetical protein n=1 Tax=Bradyrhizobium sp. CER78 TaxID=3039162 RepID=UPI002448BFCB|nr:hypothetical protein [Bradyrhizobium sp. CER78]MDH2384906.1 hypothetical protein [Bradyrhizobium sp. CER78]
MQAAGLAKAGAQHLQCTISDGSNGNQKVLEVRALPGSSPLSFADSFIFNGLNAANAADHKALADAAHPIASEKYTLTIEDQQWPMVAVVIADKGAEQPKEACVASFGSNLASVPNSMAVFDRDARDFFDIYQTRMDAIPAITAASDACKANAGRMAMTRSLMQPHMPPPDGAPPGSPIAKAAKFRSIVQTQMLEQDLAVGFDVAAKDHCYP